MKTHYDKHYFSWQKKAGEYGATQDMFMYALYVKETDTVLDFGCGGGFMLNALKCQKKYGVDINQLALKEAKKKGIRTYDSVTKIPKSVKFNVIMSHHTLEHVPNPEMTLLKIKPYLKKGGKFILVVPIDDWRNEKVFTKRDINKHLYTWTPLLLGNLFELCGFKVLKVDVITHAWVPLSRLYYKWMPKPLYKLMATAWSAFIRTRQIRIVATV